MLASTAIATPCAGAAAQKWFLTADVFTPAATTSTMAARRSVPITARKSAFRIVASAVSGRRDKDIIRTYNAICDGDHKKAQYLTSFYRHSQDQRSAQTPRKSARTRETRTQFGPKLSESLQPASPKRNKAGLAQRRTDGCIVRYVD